MNKGKTDRPKRKRESILEEGREMLRSRFEAKTDIILGNPADWKLYAEWLEKSAVRKINNEIARANELLRNKLQQAMNILEQGLTKT